MQWSSEAPGTTSFSRISGATSVSYTTPATTTAQSGTKYEATFTNAFGLTTTSAATLTVLKLDAGIARARHASVRGTVASVLVSCKGVRGAVCTIILQLTATGTPKGGGKAKNRTVIVGTKSVTLAAGHSEMVGVKLNATGQLLLKSRHELSVKLAARAYRANGNLAGVYSQTIVFKTPRKKQK